MTTPTRQILFDGLTPDEILELPDDHIAAIVEVGPIVFRVGSADILGTFRLAPDRLIVELAQIDGGGEGALPALWSLAERFARQRGLGAMEWIVHAVHCAKPNLKLRRILEKRGFDVREVGGGTTAYWLLHTISPGRAR
jgi:hypothetical protein